MQEYLSLHPGTWQLQVTATDLAGNTGTGPYPQFNWTLTLPTPYVAVMGALGPLLAAVSLVDIVIMRPH